MSLIKSFHTYAGERKARQIKTKLDLSRPKVWRYSTIQRKVRLDTKTHTKSGPYRGTAKRQLFRWRRSRNAASWIDSSLVVATTALLHDVLVVLAVYAILQIR